MYMVVRGVRIDPNSVFLAPSIRPLRSHGNDLVVWCKQILVRQGLLSEIHSTAGEMTNRPFPWESCMSVCHFFFHVRA